MSMKFNFNFKGKHKCQAALICCWDFRFRKEAQNWLEKELGLKDFDLISIPGSAKVFVDSETLSISEWYVKKIEAICQKLHHIEKIVIINHADCGAYGGRAAFASLEEEKQAHLSDLNKTKKLLSGKFPDLQIITAYADLNANQEELEIILS